MLWWLAPQASQGDWSDEDHGGGRASADTRGVGGQGASKRPKREVPSPEDDAAAVTAASPAGMKANDDAEEEREIEAS